MYISYNELNNDYILIDVRTNYEYNKNHIDKFINIPLNNIYSVRKYNKNSKIVLYCDQGRRSKVAYNILKSIGYNNLYILRK